MGPPGEAISMGPPGEDAKVKKEKKKKHKPMPEISPETEEQIRKLLGQDMQKEFLSILKLLKHSKGTSPRELGLAKFSIDDLQGLRQLKSWGLNESEIQNLEKKISEDSGLSEKEKGIGLDYLKDMRKQQEKLGGLKLSAEEMKALEKEESALIKELNRLQGEIAYHPNDHLLQMSFASKYHALRELYLSGRGNRDLKKLLSKAIPEIKTVSTPFSPDASGELQLEYNINHYIQSIYRQLDEKLLSKNRSDMESFQEIYDNAEAVVEENVSALRQKLKEPNLSPSEVESASKAILFFQNNRDLLSGFIRRQIVEQTSLLRYKLRGDRPVPEASTVEEFQKRVVDEMPRVGSLWGLFRKNRVAFYSVVFHAHGFYIYFAVLALILLYFTNDIFPRTRVVSDTSVFSVASFFGYLFLRTAPSDQNADQDQKK